MVNSKTLQTVHTICENRKWLEMGLLHFLKSIQSEDKEREFMQKLMDLKNFGDLDQLDALLNGKTLTGLKPDAYILIRNGRLNVEYSYHHLKKMVLIHHGIELETHVFLMDDLETVKKIDLFTRQIEIDWEKFTENFLRHKEFELSEIAAVLVIAKKIKKHVNYYEQNLDSEELGSKYTVLYRIRDLVNASSTAGTESFKLVVPSTNRYGKALSSFEKQSFVHKQLAMLRKTAIRSYIREYFTEIKGHLEYIEDEHVCLDDSQKCETDTTPSESFLEAKKLLVESESLANLAEAAKKIKVMTFGDLEKHELATLYSETKAGLSAEVHNIQV